MHRQSAADPTTPCVIDNGPDCQNASSCGTDNTGNHNLNGASNMPGVVGRQTSPTKGAAPKLPITVSGNKQSGAGNQPVTMDHTKNIGQSSGSGGRKN